MTTPRLAPLVLALAAIAIDPGRASACSCMAQSVEQAIADSQAIFEGRVTAIEPDGESLQVRLDVVQTWRGADAEHVEVRTASNSAACGYAFEVGSSYLVYAREVDGGLVTGLCSRTRPIEQAEEDRITLGSGSIPVDVADDPEREPRPRQQLGPRGGGCAGCTVGGGGGESALAVLVLVLAALGKKRASR